MIRVLLVHAGLIPHYRIPPYGLLSQYLKLYGFELTVASDGIEAGAKDSIEFPFAPMHLSAMKIARFIYRQKIDVIIGHMGLK